MIKFWLCCCWCLPLRHLELTSGYGDRIHPVTGQFRFHSGIDLRARSDTVYAVMAGRISAVGYDPYLGLFISLNNGDFQITYGHLSQVLVLQADSVEAGCPLGVSGRTGRVTGEHLHFAVRYRGAYTNPIQFLTHLNNFN
jgi:murein DD-endopeptidase MepM/ murein hydrolase activator NlpD